ncbi:MULTISPECIES: ATP-dependent RNA helicase SrmB [Aliiglaciecola]|uniref:ATP-dependent RNA helicase SrmB n=1 Tax=Aliiglaciecola TaxID=1406885 RepID=UPI001C0974B3|nr:MULTISPECIES: ATP-dependent RNA helicase SrmB [Aliiglaciecola]MBU2876541.1 ATP-dependent RNA helicase SrmB [Aliiglaciecola lipolytica]MDO6711524.1 ATP-dependent RNA helicase SrmB [Aliiglaciecola sp. 2_MG-2023]MDO6752500.1 ATP-dependent RNA helicase SrmB [Aliiglaciecola sp. 1_MG-2023]
MFEELDLDEKLCQAVADMGYTSPTSIQSLVIPPAMEGQDILANAPTGTGKTAAFLLPACQFLLDFPRQQPGSCRILILTPTRELALQVYEQALQITKYTDLECGVITGGINYGTDRETLEKNLDILVATPGRLFEHIEKESFDCRDIESLVLDEADRMLDMGFSAIVNQIASEARWRKQSMLFSATLEGAGIERFAKDLLTNPVSLEATPSRKEHAKILQWIHLADDPAHKYNLLKSILANQIQSAVVFVKTRDRLNQLKQMLERDGFTISWLQGEMPQDKRNSALQRFKDGEINILLATDVASRGIDVDNISHVINYDLPRTADIYVHRIGRTGRAGKKGTAISIAEAHEMGIIAKIERYTQQRFKRRVIEELRPKNKEAKAPVKKKKPKSEKKKIKRPKKKK